MEQIRAGASTGDLREAEQGAHSLKSSAANVGAHEVRSLAARIEEACLDGNDARFRELVPGLEDEFASARAALESLERDMIA